MGVEDILALTTEGETFTVEFKSEQRRPLSDGDLVEAVVCLANGDGGTLLLGVEDSGQITGSRPRHGDFTSIERVQALVAHRTQPAVSTTASLVEMPSGLSVLRIDVPKSHQPTGTSTGLYVRRAMSVKGEPECLPYLAHEMLSRVIDSTQQDYARLPISGLSWGDLDDSEFERFRRLARTAGPAGDPVLVSMSNEDIALALGVAEQRDDLLIPTAGALLLFGRVEAIERWLPQSEVLFQVFQGTSLSVDEGWRRPLLATAELALERLAPFNIETDIELGLSRVRIPRLPTTVLREVIANALIHRDYTINAPTVIQLHEATFEITSSGGFPPGVNLDNLFNVTKPRSPILSDAFKRAGLVERSGRGVKRVYEALLETGRRGPDYERSNRELVHVLVPLVEGDLELASYFALERQAGRDLDLFQLQVLFELKNTGPMTSDEIAGVTFQNKLQAAVMLNRLVEAGHVESRGSGRIVRYHLSSSVYEALGDASAYARVHGYEPEEQEQLVLDFVAEHGRITRSQVADLCKLDSREARKLLRGLVNAGQLKLRGERRGAHYVA